MSGLRSKIEAFEVGGISNTSANAKRKRSLYDAEVDRKIDFFESMKGDEEMAWRRRGPMYKRFGNLRQKLEADLRTLQASEANKENAPNVNLPQSPARSSRPATPKKEESGSSNGAMQLPKTISEEEAAANALRVAELEGMVQMLQHKYTSSKKKAHTLKKQKLDLESLVSAQREEHKRCADLQRQSEEQVRELKELNKFLSEGYESVKEEMRKKAELIRGKVLREELRKELQDKRKMREVLREKRSASASAASDEDYEAEDDSKDTAAQFKEERQKTTRIEAEIYQRVQAEYQQREDTEVMQRIEDMRREFERDIDAKLAIERAKWEELLRQHNEAAQRKESDADKQIRVTKRKLDEERENQTRLRTENDKLSLEINAKEEELQQLRTDVVVLQETIDQMQQEITKEMADWNLLKTCLEKEINRAYKELKLKEQLEAQMSDELRALREELQHAIAIAKKQLEADGDVCQHCGSSAKRMRLCEATPEPTKDAQSQSDEEASKSDDATKANPPPAAAEPSTTTMRTPSKPSPARRTVSLMPRSTPNDGKAARRSVKVPVAADEKKNDKRRSSQLTAPSKQPHISTPRPAPTKLSKSAAMLNARESKGNPSLASSSSTTTTSSSSTSPLRRASVAVTTPRKGSSLKSSASATATTPTPTSTPTRAKKERPSGPAFASTTPRFDTRLDPLRYEKLAGSQPSKP